MPAPEHVRVTVSGIFGTVATPVEEWSFGYAINCGNWGLLDSAKMEELATAIAPLWGTHLATVASSVARLTRTRVAKVNSLGKVERNAGGAFTQFDVPGAAVGAGVVSSVPLSASLVATLHTAADGPTGRGRIFLPAPVLGTLETGRVATTQRDAIATAVKNYFEAVNNTAVMVSTGNVGVASAGSLTKGIAPAVRTVTHISVGRVPDTMRSRRGRLVEERVLVPVAS